MHEFEPSRQSLKEPHEMSKVPLVVSVTPIRAESDSRSLKIAASIARFGYRSILVERCKSMFDPAGLPFQLRNMNHLIQLGSTPDQPKGRSSDKNDLAKAVRAVWGTLGEKFPILFVCWYVWRCFCTPLKSLPKASLYYLHEYSLFPAVYLLSRIRRTPVIYDAHDFYSGIRSADDIRKLAFGKRCIAAFYRYVESRLIKNAVAVVTVSDGVARLLARTFGCTPFVIRNCHDFRLDRLPAKRIREASGLMLGDFLLVIVGNAKDGMAIEQTLDAMLTLPPNVHLAFVGDNYDRHLRGAQRRVLEGRIHLMGTVPPTEIVPFIQTADAAILPYYNRSLNYENCLPNGFFQAISAELPVLYPNLPEIAKIAHKYGVGVPIDSLSSNSIRNAVMGLVADPALKLRYGENSSFAARELSWEREEKALRQLISKTLGSTGG